MIGYPPPIGTEANASLAEGYTVPSFDRSNLEVYTQGPEFAPMNFDGIGFFAGTVTRQNRPVRAIIQLVHSETGVIARTTESEVDGTFMFQNIHEGYEYHIVAIDPEGEWEHKVSSRRYPRTTL